jgi:hypothetical protein
MLQVIGPAQEVEDLINDPNFNINDWVGYIYLTCHFESGREYIGKKNFFHTKNVKLGKKELAALPVTRGRKPTTKEVITESDWKTYYGSAKEIKELDPKSLKRYVLRLCKTKKELTYWETAYLFKYDVLFDKKYINDNILGKFYRGDFEESK